MKTVLEYIDLNKQQLAGHRVFVRLRGGGIALGQRQRLLVAMADLLADLCKVAELRHRSVQVSFRPLAARLAQLVDLADDAARPAVWRAVDQAGEMLSAYLSKLAECDAVVPDPALQTLAAWDIVRLGMRPVVSTDALDETLCQRAMNLVDAVFELVEGGCDGLPFRDELIAEATAAGRHAVHGGCGTRRGNSNRGLQLENPMSTSAARATAPISLPIHYPITPIDACWLGGSQRLRLRPVLPQDESLLSAFLLAQSAGARYNRFHAAVKPSPILCRQMSQVDFRRQLALVVCTFADGVERLVAEARYSVADDGHSAEFALMVDERWQCRGVGGWVLRSLQQAAARAGVTWLEGEVLQGNQPMLSLAQRCGFACIPDPWDERLVRVLRRLGSMETGAAGPRNAPRPPALLRWLGQALTGQPGSMTRSLLAH